MKPKSTTQDKIKNQEPIILTEAYFKEVFNNSADVNFKKYYLNSVGKESKATLRCLLIYSEVMIHMDKLNESIANLEDNLKYEMNLKEEEKLNLPVNELQMRSLPPAETSKEDIADHIFSGMVLILFEEQELLYMYALPKIPNRKPEETNAEISVRGPRDGFVEDISINLALIRKRYKTATLVNETFEIGERGKTKISLLYVSDIMNEKIVDQVREELSKIDTDVILSTTDLEEVLSGHKYALVPLFNYTGRPDFVVASLNNGRFAILIDGSPNALMGPGNLTSILKTAEDRYAQYYYTNFGIMIRLAGLLIAIFLPGFYIALSSFHLDQLPFPYLATITVSRMGLPLSPQLEALMVMSLFELFKEAGITLPKAIGQTLTVVGGLIIGDAAIRGGLTSPTMLVIAGTSAVSAYTLVNQSLSTTVSIVRLAVLLLSSILGLFGFFLSVFAIVLYLSRLEVFGLPYLAPISPFSFKDTFGGLFPKPYLLDKKRSSMLKTKDKSKGKLK
ncbi:spore germination protein [Cytobacillus purgationiresistens]|uniref:Spore germination protein n=1 Tax=Cytobacillus purgationiresistens TaxID=863449 RepID=A0ABU0AP93_9BACI|nr:spore germination protein [Cytobacillus purgationiresistens]MDQ0272850.1 hypothetical protein [Cytobacillus purgationiresistens]